MPAPDNMAEAHNTALNVAWHHASEASDDLRRGNLDVAGAAATTAMAWAAIAQAAAAAATWQAATE